MIGINRKDIQAILKAGAKAKGMSTSEFKAEIQARGNNVNAFFIDTGNRIFWNCFIFLVLSVQKQ